MRKWFGVTVGNWFARPPHCAEVGFLWVLFRLQPSRVESVGVFSGYSGLLPHFFFVEYLNYSRTHFTPSWQYAPIHATYMIDEGFQFPLLQLQWRWTDHVACTLTHIFYFFGCLFDRPIRGHCAAKTAVLDTCGSKVIRCITTRSCP